MHGAGTCTRADPAAASLNPICPTQGLSTVGNGQAGNLELNAVDGGGGHGVVSLGGIVARIGGGCPQAVISS